MNILRKKRKNNIKIKLKRIILLIFSLIMTTFAWITYSKILNSKIQIDIQSWDLSFYVDKNANDIAEEEEEQENPIDVDLSDLYPGMQEKTVKVIIRNNGETPSDILYTSSEVNILGVEYTVVETAPEDTEYYILKHEPVIGEGITTVDYINEPERFPFKITVEHTQEILPEEEGYLIIKVTWPLYNEDDSEEERNRKDELDTEWGYKVAKYLENNVDNPDVTGAFHAKVRINAIGKPRGEQKDTFTSKVTALNYGDYTNYPVDIDDKTTNDDGSIDYDWRIFYADEDNVFLIADDYALNSKFTDTLTNLNMGTSESYSVYWKAPSGYGYTINASNKYMISQAGTFTSTYSNYQAVGSLLDTTKWTYFADSSGNGYYTDDIAESAIGSPTLEMFMASWNEVYGEQLYCNNANENGYYFGTTTEPTTYGKNISSLEGYGNTLYFPHTSSYNSCTGYWLASPSANNSDYVFSVYFNGYVYYDSCYISYSCGVRPVVCLKNSTTASLNGEVWELSGI